MPGLYSRYRSALLADMTSRGFSWEAHQPLAHPLILTNFTMSMAVPLLSERRKERIRDGGDFCVIQPCIRIHDSEDFAEEYNWWHLTLFEMVGAVVGGVSHRERTAKTLLDLLVGAAGLAKEHIHFEHFSGSSKHNLPEDSVVRDILLDLGVSANNIHGAEEQFFFSPSHEQAAGPMVEVYYLRDGRRLEIGTLATISYFYDEKQNLEQLTGSFTEFGVGVERLFCVAQGEQNLDVTSPMADLLGLVPVTDPMTRRLFTDRLRAVYLLLSEGLRPRARSREKILRHWMRDIGKALLEVEDGRRQEVLMDALRITHALYKDSYDILAPEETMEVLLAEFERYDWWELPLK